VSRHQADSIRNPASRSSGRDLEGQARRYNPDEVGDDDDPTGWRTARELIGCITEELVGERVAERHDQYIYRRDP